MEEFQRQGGQLLIEEASVAELERYAETSNLVIVASGKGEIGKLFERDAERSQFDKPMRTISLTYVHGMLPRSDYCALNISINPGIGEYVNFPGITHCGPCDIINLEEGGPMDRWHEVSTPDEHLALAVGLIREFFPLEAPRCENLRQTDELGTLVGRVTLTVRKPIGRLPSGRSVRGMADVLVLNDPITGQGSNNSSKGANVYMTCILEQGGDSFDDAWMQATFERYWDCAQWVTRFTNTHLLPPPDSDSVLRTRKSPPPWPMPLMIRRALSRGISTCRKASVLSPTSPWLRMLEMTSFKLGGACISALLLAMSVQQVQATQGTSPPPTVTG